MKKQLLKKILVFTLMLALITGVIPNTSDISAATKPKKPMITVSVNENGSSVTVTIRKTKRAEGYQVMVKLPGAKKYKELQILEQSGKKKRTFSVDNLDAGEYSIKVRAYRTEDGTKVWSKYSTAQTVTIEEKANAKYAVGDIVMFGSYEQDGDLKNGMEPIEWIILSNEDSKLFMVSLFALDSGVINWNYKKKLTWDESDMRKWLNEYFLNLSFTAEEAEIINATELADTGTTDKIFLLSEEDIANPAYGFAEKKDLMCGATVYAENRKPGDNMKYVWVWKAIDSPPYYVANREKLACLWWTRTVDNYDPKEDDEADYCMVKHNGYIILVDGEGDDVYYGWDGDAGEIYIENNGFGIRPALKVNLGDDADSLIIPTGKTRAEEWANAGKTSDLPAYYEEFDINDHYDDDNEVGEVYEATPNELGEVKNGRVFSANRAVIPTEGAKYLLDGNKKTKFCYEKNPGYVIWEAPETISVEAYVLMTGNDTMSYEGRNPKSWVLYGANTELPKDSEEWEVIHSVTDDKTMKPKNYKKYTFKLDTPSKPYKYFKFAILDNQDGRITQLSELTLQGTAS